jgi:hypothetical protein
LFKVDRAPSFVMDDFFAPVIPRINANRFSGWQRIYARNRRIFTYARPFRSDLVRLAMTATAYLAGPDVFLPNAVAHAATKVEICRRLGLRGLPPLNEDAEKAATELEVWRTIYEKDVAMMEKSDVIIANLTPFAGASADAGTLIEVGWFDGVVGRSAIHGGSVARRARRGEDYHRRRPRSPRNLAHRPDGSGGPLHDG